jgi:phosphoribosylformimino-5-aminoimidazole carboxamide ribotide isomerase
VSRLDDVRKLAETSRRHPNLVGAIIGRALYEGSLTVTDAIAAAG